MRRGIRRAVTGVLAVIIGFLIVAATLIPLLIRLNASGGETLRALGVVRDFQSQRSMESVDIVFMMGDFWIKNTGTVPLTIVLAVIDSGSGCSQGTFLLKTNTTLNPGDVIKNISIYTLDSICSIVTSRGNVFPVKEKQILPPPILTQNNTAFAQQLAGLNTTANYSTNSATCNTPGTPALMIFSTYDPSKKLLTINSSNTSTVLYSGGNGCFSLTFRNSVKVEANTLVVLFYRIVFIMTNNKDTFGASLTACLQSNMTACSSSTTVTWNPASITFNFIVFEGNTLIPSSALPTGTYSLNITLTFNIQGGNTAFYVGVEYIAVQGARLIIG